MNEETNEDTWTTIYDVLVTICDGDPHPILKTLSTCNEEIEGELLIEKIISEKVIPKNNYLKIKDIRKVIRRVLFNMCEKNLVSITRKRDNKAYIFFFYAIRNDFGERVSKVVQKELSRKIDRLDADIENHMVKIFACEKSHNHGLFDYSEIFELEMCPECNGQFEDISRQDAWTTKKEKLFSEKALLEKALSEAGNGQYLERYLLHKDSTETHTGSVKRENNNRDHNIMEAIKKIIIENRLVSYHDILRKSNGVVKDKRTVIRYLTILIDEEGLNTILCIDDLRKNILYTFRDDIKIDTILSRAKNNILRALSYEFGPLTQSQIASKLDKDTLTIRDHLKGRSDRNSEKTLFSLDYVRFVLSDENGSSLKITAKGSGYLLELNRIKENLATVITDSTGNTASAAATILKL